MPQPKVLLLTPPMTQLNTPYPATAYLTGFLRSRGVETVQADPAIELVLRLFSRTGLMGMRAELLARGPAAKAPAKTPPKPAGKRAAAKAPSAPPSVAHFLARAEDCIAVVDAAIRFLQGKDPSLALRIVTREYLPEGPRFAALVELGSRLDDPAAGDLGWAFGALGIQDKAKYLASLFVDDLADLVREGFDARFGLSRYGEKLAASSASFDPLLESLESRAPTRVDLELDAITRELMERHRPSVVGLTAPFPGNVYGAFRIAREVRRLRPDARIIFGGGFANTELRDLSDPRVFDYVDFIPLDDGERPILCILEHLAGKREASGLLRTFVREGSGAKARVVLHNSPLEHDIPHQDIGTPTYDGLPLDRYLSIFEMLNPMHRIWSDGRWNKLTLAHGCYWKKCNFCDVNLDYIGRYDPASADLVVDRIESLTRETGTSGFHFVDEAAPPALLKSMSKRLIERRTNVTWWGNVRFEKTFTPELAKLMADAGCVAVSGGLEVASDRLLKLMNKGVTVEQVARVTRALTDAGVMVHAYLMYGFPTETVAETIDSLERVRQLFAEGCIQSAYWHRFSATAHSPIGRDPAAFGITLRPEPKVTFARNDLQFDDPTGVDHDALGIGLRKSLYNYMLGVGLDLDVRYFFEGIEGLDKLPKPKVPSDLVARALSQA